MNVFDSKSRAAPSHSTTGILVRKCLRAAPLHGTGSARRSSSITTASVPPPFICPHPRPTSDGRAPNRLCERQQALRRHGHGSRERGPEDPERRICQPHRSLRVRQIDRAETDCRPYAAHTRNNKSRRRGPSKCARNLVLHLSGPNAAALAARGANVGLGLELEGVSKLRRHEKTAALLKLVGLDTWRSSTRANSPAA